MESGANTEKEDGFYKFPVIVFGNKTDLQEKRQVSTEEARRFLDSIGVRDYRETSATDYTSVEKAFYEIAQTAAKQAARAPVIPPIGCHFDLNPDQSAVTPNCCAVM